ncbi:MAG: preprotein translocase subunit SecE [Eubacteriales bacterium]|jgi:preprotein translocase subunit SecE|nr:preprotein translocase subunit SecE [Eubacteriales bacterium]
MSNKKQKKFLSGLVGYFKDVRAELKKVVWPTFKQIQNNTAIVIISLLLVGAMIWVIDLGFGKTLGLVVDSADQNIQMQDDASFPEGFDTEGLDNIDLDESSEIPDENVDLEGAEDTEGEAADDQATTSSENESSQSE